jgi:hypothetical protein
LSATAPEPVDGGPTRESTSFGSEPSVGVATHPSADDSISLAALLLRPESVFPADQPDAPSVGSDDPLHGLSTVAADAYVKAATWAERALPWCAIDAAFLAGIGQVATAQGTRDGNRLLASGYSATPIRGDHGGLGPLLLSPPMWAAYAADGDGDGVKSPDNMYDATIAAATSLCALAVELAPESGGSLATVEVRRQVATAFTEGDDDPSVHMKNPVDAIPVAGDAEEVLAFADRIRGALTSFASVLEHADANVAHVVVWLRAQVARGAKYAATNPGRFGTPWDGVPKKSFLSQRVYQYPAGTITYDCSGLVVMAYRQIGVDLKALDASWTGDMLAHLPQVARRDLRIGDLIIFGDGGRTTHVVVSLGGDRFLHAGSCGGGDMAVCERVGIDWSGVVGVVRVPTA